MLHSSYENLMTQRCHASSDGYCVCSHEPSPAPVLSHSQRNSTTLSNTPPPQCCRRTLSKRPALLRLAWLSRRWMMTWREARRNGVKKRTEYRQKNLVTRLRGLLVRLMMLENSKIACRYVESVLKQNMELKRDLELAYHAIRDANCVDRAQLKRFVSIISGLGHLQTLSTRDLDDALNENVQLKRNLESAHRRITDSNRLNRALHLQLKRAATELAKVLFIDDAA